MARIDLHEPTAPAAELLTGTQLGGVIDAIVRQDGPYRVTAGRLGVTVSTLNGMVNNTRRISPRVAEFFGYRRVVMFERVKP